MNMGTLENNQNTIGFKAEIKQLLNLLINSLYKDREIFLRELISNASDALTQMDFLLLTNREVKDQDAELGIWINVDNEKGIIKIRDTGIGMTKDELIENLGTIAQSGAREFIKAVEDKNQKLEDIIGQFGVGFYSVFMVADWVRVTSRSYLPTATSASWYSEGNDSFVVEVGDKDDRGTTLEIKLKEDAKEFLEKSRLREIIKKHSDFVRYPIYLGEESDPINSQIAIWRRSPKELKVSDYEEFYKHLTLEFEPPISYIHFVADAPLQIFALLYFPSKVERSIFSARKEDGLKLYVRNILIQEYSMDLLPRYYRFIQGVVDAEDLPLNVSREAFQSNLIISRIKKILTKQVTSKLKEMKSKEHEKYLKFWNEFGDFIREGIASEQEDRESLYPLLLFYTNKSADNQISLDDYIGRMKSGQKKIYYLLAEELNSGLRSPHLDYFQKSDYEVILFTHPLDAFMLLGLRSYEGFDLVNISKADIELSGVNEPTEDVSEYEPSENDKMSQLIENIKNQLGQRVSDVRISSRLSDSIARLVDVEDSPDQEIQKVYKLLNKELEVPEKVLEINPSHMIVKGLLETEDDSLQQAIIEQIYNDALLVEGLHPDPASMLANIQKLMNFAIKINEKEANDKHTDNE